MATDPVCGMEVDERKSDYESTHAGKKFYFCSQECRDKFEDNPNQFSAESAA